MSSIVGLCDLLSKAPTSLHFSQVYDFLAVQRENTMGC